MPDRCRVGNGARDFAHASRSCFCAVAHPTSAGDGFLSELDLFVSREAGPFGRRQKRARGARIPVTIVTGFLGAGKTTLVRRFLTTPEGRNTAVVINEFGAVGIDDALVRNTSEDVALLGNGCICCTTRSD